jgi:putative ABC transport system permease protein
LIRQMLTESLLLALIGGFGGAMLAVWLSDAMSLMLPPMGFPPGFNIEWDYRVSGFALALTFLTGLAVGLIPALRSVRVDPIVSIRNEAGVASMLLRSRLRSALIVTQIAVSMMSLISAGLFIRNLVAQKKVNLGFDPDRALLVSLDLFPNGYDEKRGAEFYRRIAERVSALPGVESASLSNNVPPTMFGGTNWTHEIEGYAPRPNENMGIEYEVVGTGYFRTMRIPIVGGREFEEADRAQSTPLAIVNETMARRYWPGQSALGKRLRGGGGPWATIIGVARDVKNIDATEPARPWMYYPLAQSYNSEMTLVVRTAGDPLLAFADVRGAIRALDATLPLSDVMTLETHCDVPLFLDRIVVTFLNAFGLLALGLAAIGLYGVMAYSVAARTREIAIRMALGAQTTDVLKLVIRQGMTLTAIGVVIGSISALGLTQLIRELLFGVSTADPLTFISIALLLIVVALLAAYMPARRAAKVDPMVALRWE